MNDTFDAGRVLEAVGAVSTVCGSVVLAGVPPTGALGDARLLVGFLVACVGLYVTSDALVTYLTNAAFVAGILVGVLAAAGLPWSSSGAFMGLMALSASRGLWQDEGPGLDELRRIGEESADGS
jgi:hypothetical protein